MFFELGALSLFVFVVSPFFSNNYPSNKCAKTLYQGEKHPL